MIITKHYIQSCLETSEFQKDKKYSDSFITLELVDICHREPTMCIGAYNNDNNDTAICQVFPGSYQTAKWLIVKPGHLIFDKEMLISTYYRLAQGIKMVVKKQECTGTGAVKRKIE